MMTPAEMMSMRWPTVLFLNERGSSSSSSASGPLADHLDVAAQREHADLVGRLAALEAATGQGRAEADAEGLHVDVAPLGGQEVAQLVDEDDEAEAEDDLGDGPDAVQSELVPDEADDGADQDER